MSIKYNINIRLPTKFQNFRKDFPVFDDCVIQMKSGKQFRCNRIFLAKNSKVFYKYFLDHPKTKNEFLVDNVIVFEVSDIDDNSMEDFLNMLYHNYIKLTVYNIPKLLKIASSYQFTEITPILRSFYLDAANDETLLYLAKEFIQNGLESEAKCLSPLIATHLIRIEQHDATEKFKCDDIYNALSPSIFSAVLIERNKLQSNKKIPSRQGTQLYLYNYGPFSNEVTSICYIEDYVKLKGLKTLTSQDKEDLASVIDWSNPISYIYLTEYPCDWLPAKYARPLISIILKKRVLRLRDLSKEIKKSSGTTSRWFLISSLRSIQKGGQYKEPLPAIELIRTLGGLVPPFDPVKYGLLNIKSSKPLIRTNPPENSFIRDPHSYFISKTEGSTMPYIEFDLGPHISFKPKEFILDSRVRYLDSQFSIKKSEYAKNKGLVEFVDVISSTKDNEETTINHCPIPKPESNEGAHVNIPDCSKMKFVLNGKTSSHYNIFRVSTLEVIGEFSF